MAEDAPGMKGYRPRNEDGQLRDKRGDTHADMISPSRPEPAPRKRVLSVSGTGHNNRPVGGTGCGTVKQTQ